MMRTLLFFASTGLILSACNSPLPITGGPCKYESETVTGQVTGEGEHHIELEGREGAFQVAKHQIGHDVDIGEEIAFERLTIIQGTCTPVIYSVVSD